MIRPSRISSSRWQRSASSMTWLETKTAVPGVGEPVEERPEVLAQDRVEADRGLVEHQQVGAAEQRDREAGPAALAAAEPADDLVAVRRQVDGLDDPVDLLAGRRRAPGRRTGGSRRP